MHLPSLLLLATIASAPRLQEATVVADVRDLTGADVAFVELETPRTEYFVQQPIPILLRVGFESDFLANEMVQLFRQRLDIPVQLQVDWIDAPHGTVRLPARAAATTAPDLRTFALNESLAEAAQAEIRQIDGRAFTVLELERTYAATSPGGLSLSAPRLRFAYAEEFADDPFHGRMATDRHDAIVLGNGLHLAIRSFPEEGRPPQFLDAIGDFTISADVEPRSIVMGASFKLAVHLEGTGNLSLLEPPHLDDLRDFHVYGSIEVTRPTGRTILYDIAPRHAGIAVIPPITFAFLDPGPPAVYRTIKTHPLPITIESATDGDASTERAMPVPGGDSALSTTAIAWSGAGLTLVILFVRRAARKRARATRN